MQRAPRNLNNWIEILANSNSNFLRIKCNGEFVVIESISSKKNTHCNFMPSCASVHRIGEAAASYSGMEPIPRLLWQSALPCTSIHDFIAKLTTNFHEIYHNSCIVLQTCNPLLKFAFNFNKISFQLPMIWELLL